MSNNPKEKDNLDYSDLNREEVEEYVDDYFWGDDDDIHWAEDLYDDQDHWDELEDDEFNEDDDPAGSSDELEKDYSEECKECDDGLH